MFQVPTESFQQFQQQCQQYMQTWTKHTQQLQKTASEVASEIVSLNTDTISKISSQPHPFQDGKSADVASMASAQVKLLSETGNILVKHTSETLGLLKKFGEEYAKCCKAQASAASGK